MLTLTSSERTSILSETVVLMMEMMMMLNGDPAGGLAANKARLVISLATTLMVPSLRSIVSNLKSTWLEAAHCYQRFSYTLLQATKQLSCSEFSKSENRKKYASPA